MVLSILSIGPASAVQIESVNHSVINQTLSDKNLENNDKSLDYNNTQTNQTVIKENNKAIELNGTKTNDTYEIINLNKTINNTNETTDLNKTIDNNTNKTENNFDTKSLVTSTLDSVANIFGAFTGIAFTVSCMLLAAPEPTPTTKVLAAVGFVFTASLGAVSLGCAVAAIFCRWFW